jgi:protocatechuate 3,4-dioxygenase, alpha subunit
MTMVPSPSQTLGPFFHFGLTDKHSIREIADAQAQGERVHLRCRVLDGDGVPVNDAMLEIWQANSEGKYNHPDDRQQKGTEPGFYGFGRAATDEEGNCEFHTIKPGRVPGPGNTLQAPHLNLAVFARGMLRQVYTRIYFLDDPANLEDAILGTVPEERRATLFAHPNSARSHGWDFAIHLQGEQETVFFDV